MKTHMSSITRAVGLVVVVAAVAIIVWALVPIAPYADGGLIDVTHPQGIAYEEDGDLYELGWRLVKFAASEPFTAKQQEQLGDLVGDLFEEIRNLGMDIERLQAQVEQLREQIGP